MRLMHGSLTNCLYDNAPFRNDPKSQTQLLERGAGGTICGWSDRRACSVLDWHYTASDRLVVRVQEDLATRTDSNGMSECQSYAYDLNPHGAIHTFRQKKDGVLRDGTTTLALGRRDHYYDYSF